jgi:WD40 repeat protein/tRNA A-37 threonylcarbamoyl transferase component Bud32
MKPADEREEILLREALQKANGPERKGFLDGVCRGDDALRAKLEALLQAHESPEPFLEPQAALAAASTVLLPPEEGPGTLIGRYRILEQIGEGGFGVVYVAEQREPVKRRVALKVIKLGMDTKQVAARFEAERQALALMDHPNIAKVLDAGATEAGRPFFVMELVKGIPITRYCDQEKLATRARLDLFIQVCHAIQHAHQKGIIHRDIKPSNILVTLHDGVAVPKVIDFGIAKATQQELTEKTVYTQLQQFIGTPAYMSPEQAEMSGLDIDTRSDIYSLGVLLYELLTASTPFDTQELLKSGLDEMRKIIRERQPVRPSTRLTQQLRLAADPKIANRKSQIANDLDWIVMKCLEKDRARRYETANGLAQDIERHLKNEPVMARPPSVGYRLQKSFRRNRLVFTAAGAVGLALVLGVVVSSWQATRAMKAGRREVEAARVADSQRERAENEAQKAKASELAARQNLYAADMNLVQQAWEQNNVRQARRLLEETAMYPERGFEWYYWQRQTHQELKTLCGHAGVVCRVAFSPDGQRIATGSLDGTVKVWETTSGGELLTLKGHGAELRSVAFSPDGGRIVTGSNDRTAKVWDAASGQELLTLKGHSSTVLSAVFSPDGQRIVTGSSDQTAKVWEIASAKELFTLTGHSGWVGLVAFSPDGQRIITLSSDQTVKVWDAAGGRELFTSKGLSVGLYLVQVSPDGQRIVTSDGDHLKVWEAATGRELLTFKGHSAHGFGAFSRDGRRIVTWDSDLTAKVWDAASGEGLFTLKGHSGVIWYAAFSPGGQRIVTGSADQTAKVWDAASGNEPLALKGHSQGIRSVAFSPDGQRIVTGSNDRTAKVWEAASGHELFALRGHSDRIFSAAFSPDGQRIVTGSADQLAKVWDAASSQELFALRGHSAEIWSVAFSPDGQWVVTGSADQTAKVWDAAKGSPLLTLTGHAAGIRSVAFSPDGQRIITGSLDRTARVWATAGGKELLTLNGHSNQVNCVVFSPDGHRIVTGSEDQTAKVWEAAGGKELLTLTGHSAGIWAVAFSPDGQRIMTGSQDGATKIWDAASGRELLTLKGAADAIWSVACSPDGQRIVTGGEKGITRIWDAATPQQVAGWQREEKAVTEHLAAQWSVQARAAAQERALRVRDPGVIKQWLLLAPIGLESRMIGGVALDQEQIPQEANLRPRAGERVKVSEGERVWRRIQLEDYLIDFNVLLGELTAWSVGYAVCYIQSDTAQTHLIMKVGSDDAARVYLNAKEIYQWRQNRVWMPDQDEAHDVELKAGLNVLVFKVVNFQANWQGSIRFTDAAGQPLKGIRVTLDPEAKD